MVRIFHHNDHDGRLAAFWVISAYYHPQWQATACHEVDYGRPFPIQEIKPGDTVWIVDFSIEPDMMRQILDAGHFVFWVDHHVSAIAKYKEFDWKKLKTIRCTSSEYAACVLVWGVIKFLGGKIGLDYGDITDLVIETIHDCWEEIPLATRYVGDYDSWAHRYRPDSTHFILGSSLADMDPHSDFWDDVNTGRNDLMRSTLEHGSVIERYRDSFNEEYRSRYAYEVEWEGHKCLVMNMGHGSSLAFGPLSYAYNICICAVFNGECWTVSLYADQARGVDVSKIAAKYEWEGRRGGGHKGAAGFQCGELPFRKAAAE